MVFSVQAKYPDGAFHDLVLLKKSLTAKQQAAAIIVKDLLLPTGQLDVRESVPVKLFGFSFKISVLFRVTLEV